MTTLTFKTLSFEEKGNKMIVSFLKNFYFELNKEDLNKISKFKIKNNSITFQNISEKKANNKFNFLISKEINNLKNKLNNHRTIYIHQNSGIPLIGNSSFGIIDRGTNLLEIKPVTSCNLNCIFCSVDEGLSSKKIIDYVVEKDYLVNELKKIIKIKNSNNIETHIDTQGEPLFYSELVDLVSSIKEIPKITKISIDTNGTLLTKDLIDELVKAGLTRFNISMNAIDPKTAKKLAGTAFYDIEHIKNMTKYASQKTDLIISPILIPEINDEEIEKIIQFRLVLKQEHKIGIGIQNFLNYRFGRNPTKQLAFDEFYHTLKSLENKYNTKLILNSSDFDIKKDISLKKPFRKGNTIKAKIICPGRYKNEMLAVSCSRTILLHKCFEKINKTVKIKITRSKHNIFIGELV